MAEQHQIMGYVKISNKQIIADGQLLFEKQDASPKDFFNAAYDFWGINYPKFFKMDNLCKTGFIAAEILLRKLRPIDTNNAFDTGILFNTANASLDTDQLYQTSTQTAPSPSLFVYTLANIVVGELCIRHGIKGESTCFVFDEFNAAFNVDYLNSLLDTGKINTGIVGWADYYDEKFEAFFYIASKSGPKFLFNHTPESVNKLYYQT